MKLYRLDVVKSVFVGENIVESISNARKVFKFMRFVDVLKKIYKMRGKNGNKHGQVVKVLSYVYLVFSFFYYLLDNVVWFTFMGMIK